MVDVSKIRENGAGKCQRLQGPGIMYPSSRQVKVEPAELNLHDADDTASALLFIIHSGGARLKRQDQALVHSHARTRKHIHQKKEREVYKTRKKLAAELHPAPDVDIVLGLGAFDSFNVLPIKMSSSDRRSLDYCKWFLVCNLMVVLISTVSSHIAPLHYPPGLLPKYKETNSTTRVALTDPALLHSILGATNGHLLFYAKVRTVSISDVLHHKMEAMRMVNERLASASSENLTDETLAAVTFLITSQTRQGDYEEMKIHLGGLLQLVRLRGGLEKLGMGGLLAGEIRWCDNVTALSSSAKPLLLTSQLSKMPYKRFKPAKFNTFFGTNVEEKSSPFSNPSLAQLLSTPLISILHDLQNMTNLLNTIPQFSEHDMLVYDQRRATIQHNIANLSIPTSQVSFSPITEPCRLAAGIYSIIAMYSFLPPLKLYGDLARRLKEALEKVDHVCYWGPGKDLLLWMLFVGGYAALGREERAWFVGMIGFVERDRGLRGWKEVRLLLEVMPVHHILWDPFEELWQEGMTGVFDSSWM